MAGKCQDLRETEELQDSARDVSNRENRATTSGDTDEGCTFFPSFLAVKQLKEPKA